MCAWSGTLEDMTTTLEPPARGSARSRRLGDQLVRVAEAATTPYLPADFMDLFAPLRSGAGLGNAGIDDDAGGIAAGHLEPLEAGLDRRGAELVLGEDRRSRHRLSVLGRQQADVAACAILDSRVETGSDKAFSKRNAQG